MKKAPERLRFAAIAIDVVVFGIHEGKLSVLLDTVNRPPHYVDVAAFIGGLVEFDETAEDAVVRHLRDKVGLRKVYTEQLYTFSEIERDKRNRVISISYIGLVQPDVVHSFVHASARWCPVRDLPQLAYDHSKMAEVALARLRGKFEYTTIALHLLPRDFTLTQLQETYEMVLWRELDKRNFRKKILSLKIVKDTGRVQEGVKNRPAALYQFKNQTVTELTTIV